MKLKLWSVATSASLVAFALIANAGPLVAEDAAAKASNKKTDLPKYVVDPYWPKPLPNRWVTGEVGGICVDSNDHIFGINRRNVNALEEIGRAHV